jgi:hypothetical protein
MIGTNRAAERNTTTAKKGDTRTKSEAKATATSARMTVLSQQGHEAAVERSATEVAAPGVGGGRLRRRLPTVALGTP